MPERHIDHRVRLGVLPLTGSRVRGARDNPEPRSPLATSTS